MGNFKEMCQLMSKYKPDFCEIYKNHLVNHTSSTIQNALIEICGENIKSTIVQEIKKCGMFSIFCDEAR